MTDTKATVEPKAKLTIEPFNLFKELKTDDSLEVEGTWVYPYGPEKEGNPGFKIARMGGANSKYDSVNTAALKDYQHLIRAGLRKMDAHVLRIIREASKKAFIETCMLNWKNVRNADKKEIPFSKTAAEDLFTQLPQVYEDLFERASDLKTFQNAVVSDEAGNL